MASKSLRWAPAVAVPVVIAAVAIVAPLSANAASDLPEKSPSEVLQLVQGSSVSAFSGTIEQTSDLGLPDISGASGGSGAAGGGADSVSAAMELLTGSHTAKVFVGDAGARVQILDSLAERDVITNGDDVWFYDSAAQTAVHTTLDGIREADARAPGESIDAPDPADVTPAALADRLLAGIEPTTTVAVGSDISVAGRDAYDLVLSPSPDGSSSLIGSVSIAVDGETGLPLRVQVTASGATAPAFSVGFTSLSLDAPDPSLFDFTPPDGTDVTEKTHDDPSATEPQSDASGEASVPDAAERPSVVAGSGWATIVRIPAPTAAADGSEAAPDATDGANDSDLGSMLSTATTPVDGGRVLSTALVSVLLADDGSIYAGAVSAEALEAAASAAR